MFTTSDWTDLYLVSGATWQGPSVVSTTGVDARVTMTGGRLNLSQPLNQADVGKQVEALFEVLIRGLEEEAPVVFGIERGGLGATWVEVYRFSGTEWVLVDSFAWRGHSTGDRNASNFEVSYDSIFGEMP